MWVSEPQQGEQGVHTEAQDWPKNSEPVLGRDACMEVSEPNQGEKNTVWRQSHAEREGRGQPAQDDTASVGENDFQEGPQGLEVAWGCQSLDQVGGVIAVAVGVYREWVKYIKILG